MSAESQALGLTPDELEAAFQEAANRVADAATSSALPSDKQLLLYGLYKQATCGDCTSHRPPFFDIKARSKWSAWKNMEGMGTEEAKLAYFALVNEILPLPEAGASSANQKQGALGPVVSRMRDEDEEDQPELGELHARASEGNWAEVDSLLNGGAEVDARDSEGCTPLHWVADRGSVEVLEVLLKRGAHVNAQNSDGQTPLHFAALCGQAEVVRRLLAAGADATITSLDGDTCSDLATPDILEVLKTAS